MTRRKHLLAATVSSAALALSSGAVPASAQTSARSGDARAQLRTYAADTWRSMAAMADPGTGLVSDNVSGSLESTGRAAYTSPTNIGAYVWSAVAAREIGIISRGEAKRRIARTLTSLQTLEIHGPSGMFYNWYDPATGAKLTRWPVDGGVVNPFLSSVDNAWLATALEIVIDQVPALADQARPILARMDFGYFYDPVANQLRGGFWVVDPNPDSPNEVKDNYRDDSGLADVYYTGNHYGAFNTEPRMASYLGISSGQIPERHYFGTYRTFPAVGCDWSWTEQKPVGSYRTYPTAQGDVQVFEGAYTYRGKRFVPTWGGSMFEALMVPLFVPEETWGTRSWALTHGTYVRAQIEHGLDETGYGYWGFSPSNDPAGGYREYGVDQLGMNPDGYTSDEERTTVDEGYGDCRPAQPAPTAYGRGVVTPHASFLALRYARAAALANLAKLRASFDAYGPGGFYDAVDVTTGEVSRRYLSLDQGMVMAALGNALAGDVMRKPFEKGPMATAVAPLMRSEEFSGITGAGG